MYSSNRAKTKETPNDNFIFEQVNKNDECVIIDDQPSLIDLNKTLEHFTKNYNNNTIMEKYITIITNAKEEDKPTGKSFLANQISLNYDNVVYIPGKNISKLNDPFTYYDVDETTEMIIIDDVPKKYLLDVWQCFFNDKMTLEPKGLPKYIINTPNIIITSSVVGSSLLPIGGSYTGRSKIIETEIIEREDSKIFKAKRIL